VAEGISPSNKVVSTSGVGGSYIRILRSDSAVLGGRQFVTLIFGEEPPARSLIAGSVWPRADEIGDA
jgi:hypothetical protein